MTRRHLFVPCLIAVLLAWTGPLSFAQSDRGTITGTVTDKLNNLIAGASVTATNQDSGSQTHTATTDTGYYTLADLPAGTYSVTVEATGFDKLVRSGITVSVNVTARIDLTCTVGSIAETITVTEDAPLLETESAENETTITTNSINALPLNMAGASAIRNPLSFSALTPGSTVGSWNDIHINGSPGPSFRIILDGQDSGSGLAPQDSDEQQPSVEALQEFTLQADSFPPEFGQTIGGIFNYTSKSGANAIHGSLYEYMANDKLDATEPFNSGLKPRVHQNDFGGSFGGPIWIPKIYNGHDKTWFFFNYEMYRKPGNTINGNQTVPTVANRNGDFSASLTGAQAKDSNGNLVFDPLGRPVWYGAIYDPATIRVDPASGKTVADPFGSTAACPNCITNVIPASRFDPVAVNVLKYFPQPSNDNPNKNYPSIIPSDKYTWIPSIKVDHQVSERIHLSSYYSQQEVDKDNAGDGLPDPISVRRYQIIKSNTFRLNADYAIRPTLDLHVGIGFQYYHNPDATPFQSFDSTKELGLPGAMVGGFPQINQLQVNGQIVGQNSPTGYTVGAYSDTLFVERKPTIVAALSWLKGSHNYKFGGEWRKEWYLNGNKINALGAYTFNSSQTTMPWLNGVDVGGAPIGSSMASFMLGAVASEGIGDVVEPWWLRNSSAIYAQDSWKITRKLTLTYGVRYDMQQKQHELNRWTTSMDPTLTNPSANNLPGAMIYEGNGTGRCNCSFEHYYPYAFGPRLAAMYQLNEKTVLHGAAAVVFGNVNPFNYVGSGYSQGFGWNTVSYGSAGTGLAAAQFQNGVSYTTQQLTGTNFDPGVYPGASGVPNGLPAGGWFMPGNGRPPKTDQFNVGVQRQIVRNLSVQASYVGVVADWIEDNSLRNPIQLTQSRLSTYGLNLANAADRALLAEPLSSADVAARGFTAPYSTFPTSESLASALMPFPQFGSGLRYSLVGDAVGNYWYNALQITATQRLSRGLWVLANYTWAKDIGTVNDNSGDAVSVGNQDVPLKTMKTLPTTDIPHTLNISYQYELPTFGLARNWATRTLLKGWTTTGILHYASGVVMQIPGSNAGLTSITFASNNFMNRVPGQKLFLHSLNKHNVNPYTTLFLNPNAWQEPAPGTYNSGKPFLDDYRGPRYPNEQMGLAKNTKLSEKVTFNVRADFFNIFNRWAYPGLNNTSNTGAQTQYGNDGAITNGFGYIGDSMTGEAGNYPARTGQIVARIQF